MPKDSFITRGVRFALLFGPPEVWDRGTASDVHSRICDSLSMDDIAFKYTPPKQNKQDEKDTFMTEMTRVSENPNEGDLSIVIDNTQPQPGAALRLVIANKSPRSPRHAKQNADNIATAVLQSNDYEVVLVETRLRAECSVNADDANEYIEDKLYNLSEDFMGEFSPQEFLSINIESGKGDGQEPERELTLETLRENEKKLYIEYVSKWSGPHSTNLVPFDADDPSVYIQNSYDFLKSTLSKLPDITEEEDQI